MDQANPTTNIISMLPPELQRRREQRKDAIEEFASEVDLAVRAFEHLTIQHEKRLLNQYRIEVLGPCGTGSYILTDFAGTAGDGVPSSREILWDLHQLCEAFDLNRQWLIPMTELGSIMDAMGQSLFHEWAELFENLRFE